MRGGEEQRRSAAAAPDTDRLYAQQPSTSSDIGGQIPDEGPDSAAAAAQPQTSTSRWGPSSFKALFAKGDIEKPESIFERHVREGTAESMYLTDLIKGLIASGRLDRAREHFDRAVRGEAGYPPANSFHYTCLIDGYLDVPRLHEAWALTERMLREFEGQMTAGPYSVAVRACCAVALDARRTSVNAELGQRCEALAKRLVDEALERRVLAEIADVQPMIDFYARMGRIQDGIEVIRRCMAAGIQLRPGFFATLISGCARLGSVAGLTMGAGLLELMREHGVKPDEFVWGAYLKLCMAFPEAAARELAGRLRAKRLAPDADGLATLLLGEMSAAGLTVSSVCYNTVIQHLVNTQQDELALGWVQRARGAGQATPATYTILLKRTASSGWPDPAQAYKALAMMREDGLEPDWTMKTLLVKIFANAGELERAQALVAELLEASEAGAFAINSVNLSVIFASFGRMKSEEGARRATALLGALRAGKHGGTRNLERDTVNAIVTAYSRSREPETTVRVARELLEERRLRANRILLEQVAKSFWWSHAPVQIIDAVNSFLEDERLAPASMAEDAPWGVLVETVFRWEPVPRRADAEKQRVAAARRLLVLLKRYGVRVEAVGGGAALRELASRGDSGPAARPPARVSWPRRRSG
eukprot:tig00020848_g14617.t1